MIKGLAIVGAALALLLLAAANTPPTAASLRRAGRHLLPTRQLGEQQSSASSAADSMSHFVTRRGDQLYLQGKPFRFVSFNAPDLHVVEDGSWHPVAAWEQADALETIRRAGGQVVRIYTMSIVGGLNNGSWAHVLGPERYNEALFRDLDRLLALARAHGVRLVLPFIDNWEWWGGIKQFAALYGKPFGAFYRDAAVRAGFKDLVRFLLLRNNTETGVLYKDDPTILAWETGNELDYDWGGDTELPTRAEMDAWTADVAAHIKALDPNHLVVDGRLLRNRDVGPSALADPNLDVITDHFYPNTPYSFSERLDRMLGFTRGRRPFLVGEFGLVDPPTVEALLARVVGDEAVAGALLWSLRPHSASGGFYWHNEYDNWYAYHYPGFPSNAQSGEPQVMAMMEKAAYAIRGLPVPPRAPPGRPELLDSSTTDAIVWRGAVGAVSYELQRQELGAAATGAAEKGAVAAAGGKWTTVASELSDAANPFVPYADATAAPGRAYRYRIVAVNEAGRGLPSQAVTIGSKPRARPGLEAGSSSMPAAAAAMQKSKADAGGRGAK